MQSLTAFTLLAVALGRDAAAAQLGSDQGPAAMYWPPDRNWASEVDNQGPCGSTSASSGERVDFPLKNARISFTMRHDAYNVTISIANVDNPVTQGVFNVLLNPTRDQDLDEFDPGHQCVPVPDATDRKQGDLATIQLMYVSDFDGGVNDTFYACSDIRFVDPNKFDPTQANRLCFDTDPIQSGEPFVHPETSSAAGSGEQPQKSGKGGLSGGAIAGIVVGAVAGVALLLGAFFLFRKWQSKKRREKAVNLRMNELTNPAKNADESGSERQV